MRAAVLDRYEGPAGLRIDEVPSRWIEREHGKSRFRVGGWLLSYLRWYLYAFETSIFRRGAETVKVREGAGEIS